MSVSAALPRDLLATIRTLNREQLDALAEASQIARDYGQLFSETVGLERLFSLPKVSPEEIGLASAAKYPFCNARPSELGDFSVGRGIVETAEGGTKARLQYPFIAIKVELLDPIDERVVGVMVEVLSKRYPVNDNHDGAKGRFHENNYIAGDCTLESGKIHPSVLYSTGGMREEQIEAVSKLLNGETIPAPTTSRYLIRMA